MCDVATVSFEITIWFSPMTYQKIGIVSPKGQSANGIDLDDRIFMPIETVRKRIQGIRKYNPKAVDWVTVKMLDGYDMTFAKEDIINALRARMKIGPNQDNNFTVKNLSEMYEARQRRGASTGGLHSLPARVSVLRESCRRAPGCGRRADPVRRRAIVFGDRGLEQRHRRLPRLAVRRRIARGRHGQHATRAADNAQSNTEPARRDLPA